MNECILIKMVVHIEAGRTLYVRRPRQNQDTVRIHHLKHRQGQEKGEGKCLWESRQDRSKGSIIPGVAVACSLLGSCERHMLGSVLTRDKILDWIDHKNLVFSTLGT